VGGNAGPGSHTSTAPATPTGVEQERYALLVTDQILRTAMCDATNTVPGIDPDRASFTTALHAARDQLIHAAGVIAETVIDLVGRIGRLVLDNLETGFFRGRASGGQGFSNVIP